MIHVPCDLVLLLSKNIGHRASVYVEEYSLGFGISAYDALIAATAMDTLAISIAVEREC